MLTQDQLATIEPIVTADGGLATFIGDLQAAYTTNYVSSVLATAATVSNPPSTAADWTTIRTLAGTPGLAAYLPQLLTAITNLVATQSNVNFFEYLLLAAIAAKQANGL